MMLFIAQNWTTFRNKVNLIELLTATLQILLLIYLVTQQNISVLLSFYNHPIQNYLQKIFSITLEWKMKRFD